MQRRSSSICPALLRGGRGPAGESRWPDGTRGEAVQSVLRAVEWASAQGERPTSRVAGADVVSGRRCKRLGRWAWQRGRMRRARVQLGTVARLDTMGSRVVGAGRRRHSTMRWRRAATPISAFSFFFPFLPPFHGSLPCAAVEQ